MIVSDSDIKKEIFMKISQAVRKEKHVRFLDTSVLYMVEKLQETVDQRLYSLKHMILAFLCKV